MSAKKKAGKPTVSRKLGECETDLQEAQAANGALRRENAGLIKDLSGVRRELSKMRARHHTMRNMVSAAYSIGWNSVHFGTNFRLAAHDMIVERLERKYCEWQEDDRNPNDATADAGS